MNWYWKVLRKYAVFNGRASRMEYSMFFLFNGLMVFTLGFLEGVVGLAPDTDQSVLAILYTVAVLLPAVALGVRRLHDIGRSGWWMVTALFPYIGLIALVLLMVLDGEAGDNQYGPSLKPLAVPTTALPA